MKMQQFNNKTLLAQTYLTEKFRQKYFHWDAMREVTEFTEYQNNVHRGLEYLPNIRIQNTLNTKRFKVHFSNTVGI